MKAKYNTACSSCGEPIKPGKEIAKDSSGNWVHKHCMTDIVDLP
jgi:hypothetical protein